MKQKQHLPQWHQVVRLLQQSEALTQSIHSRHAQMQWLDAPPRQCLSSGCWAHLAYDPVSAGVLAQVDFNVIVQRIRMPGEGPPELQNAAEMCRRTDSGPARPLLSWIGQPLPNTSRHVLIALGRLHSKSLPASTSWSSHAAQGLQLCAAPWTWPYVGGVSPARSALHTINTSSAPVHPVLQHPKVPAFPSLSVLQRSQRAFDASYGQLYL